MKQDVCFPNLWAQPFSEIDSFHVHVEIWSSTIRRKNLFLVYDKGRISNENCAQTIFFFFGGGGGDMCANVKVPVKQCFKSFPIPF